MDVFSHGLWAGAVYKFLNLKRKTTQKFNFWAAAGWGMFPDLLSFTIPFIWMLLGLIFGFFSFSQLPRTQEMEPIAQNVPLVFKMIGPLYTASHSMLVFLAVFLFVMLIFRRPIWVMGGWFIHIFMDIFTHSYDFYPTPFLWPISNWKFNGVHWGQAWFMALDITLLVIAYGWLRVRERKLKRKKR